MTIYNRKKPIKPTRKYVSGSVSLHYYSNVKQLMDKIRQICIEYNLSEKDFNISIESAGYDECYCDLIYRRRETEDEFQRRVNVYNDLLKKYKKWKSENSGEIKRLKEKELTSQKKDFEDKLKKIQSELNKLRKKS